MMIKLAYVSRLGVVLLAGVLTACAQSSSDRTSTAISSPTISATPVASNPIAKISEIRNLPVFVRLLSAAQEQPAKEGMGLQFGETIRTQGQALTQIDLNSGLAFRLAGDAVLTLQPDNRLNLKSGDMITWVQPGKKVPTEIVTPVAVAGIRGTTVFVKIPKDPKEGVLFFAWEGSVAVRLPGQTEDILLKTADEVRIKPGDRDIRQIRQRVRRMSRTEWRQKRQNDPLLRSFKKAKMSTLSIIEQIKPGQVTLQALPKPSGKPQKPTGDRQANKQERDDRVKQKPDKADKALKPKNNPGDRKPERSKKDDRELEPEKPLKRDRDPKALRDDRSDAPQPEASIRAENHFKKGEHSQSDEHQHPKRKARGRDRGFDRDGE
ncbi:MAG: FecR domain-containing protein [Verrucomicrobia bacterium]|nr:FecR domain-containing protein [Leptolyngbya sp. ES-bin-22]